MEDFVLRFPLAGQKIVNNLNNQDLAKFKEVSKLLSSFIEKDRSFWKRILQKYSEKHATYKDSWISVTKKLPIKKLKQLALIVEKFYIYRPKGTKFQHSPLHIVAECGNIVLFRQFAEKTGSINPKRNDGVTSLHLASQEGHLNICKYIISNSEDKNPKDNRGYTPLYFAA